MPGLAGRLLFLENIFRVIFVIHFQWRVKCSKIPIDMRTPLQVWSISQANFSKKGMLPVGPLAGKNKNTIPDKAHIIKLIAMVKSRKILYVRRGLKPCLFPRITCHVRLIVPVIQPQWIMMWTKAAKIMLTPDQVCSRSQVCRLNMTTRL